MNNSTRNLKMKKLLIATTALVATAGIASADITITGHAAAGIYSGLDFTAAKKGLVPTTNTSVVASTLSSSTGALTAGSLTAAVMPTTPDYSTNAEKKVFQETLRDKRELLAQAKALTASTHKTIADAELAVAAAEADLAIASDTAESKSGDGVYSNAGVDFTMTGATDNGISFSATVNIDAGMEVDTGDFELDGKDGGTAGLGAVTMSGTFGTLTFDESGIDNLYSDATTHDVSYATTVGAVALTVGHSVGAAAADTDSAKATSFSASTTQSGMAFTLTGSETAAGTSTSLAMSYALNDTVTITADTDQVAGAESVQTIGAKTTLNGVSVSVESANNSTWDVDLGYSAGGFALTYGVDETDAWTATATTALGGGATFAAGISSDNEMYAGVSFAF
jgi:outer membrane protein OmpU